MDAAISSIRSGWAAAKPGPVTVAQPSRRKRRSGTPFGGDASRDAVTAAGGSESSGLGGRVPSSTRRPTRSGQRSASCWAIIPPIESPTTVGGAETEVVDDAAGVVGQVGDRVRPRGVAGPAAAAVVDADHPVVALEGGDQITGPHQARRRPPVEEHDGRTGDPPSWWWIGCAGRQATSGRSARAHCSARMPASNVAATAGLRASDMTSIPDAAAQRVAAAVAMYASRVRCRRSNGAPERRPQDRSRRRSLPVVVRGSASTNVTVRGTLYRARCSRTCSLTCAWVSRAPGAAHDERLQPLAELLVGHADDGGLEDRRVGGQEVLDLGREHVLAAGHDHVVVAAVDEEAPVGVEVAEVAARQQTVDLLLAAAAGVAVEAGAAADEDPPDDTGRHRPRRRRRGSAPCCPGPPCRPSPAPPAGRPAGRSWPATPRWSRRCCRGSRRSGGSPPSPAARRAPSRSTRCSAATTCRSGR